MTRTRRDHMKYLTLIRSIALLHQYQRERKSIIHNGEPVEYIEVTRSDIALANQLAHEILGRSLDELPPQTRRLVTLVDSYVTTECVRQQIDRCDFRFSRKDIRQFTRWGETQLRIHLDRLVELEYLLVHRGGRGQSFVYELLYEPGEEASKPLLAGLVDAALIGTTSTSRGQTHEIAGASRDQSGVVAATSRQPRGAEKASREAALRIVALEELENAHGDQVRNVASYARGSGTL